MATRPLEPRETTAAPAAAGIVEVPDLVGMASHVARRVVQLSGLGMVFVERPSEGGFRGRILRQDPGPGTNVRPGDTVTVDVGARLAVAIPEVRGADEVDALDLLRAAGLLPSRRVVRRSRDVAPGSVIRTRPRAGSEVPTGTRIAYVVASAPRTERTAARHEARRDRVRRLPDGAYLSMPGQE